MLKAIRFVALNPKDLGKLRSSARICIEVPGVAFRRQTWVVTAEWIPLSATLNTQNVRNRNQPKLRHTLNGGGRECPPYTVKKDADILSLLRRVCVKGCKVTLLIAFPAPAGESEGQAVNC
jgi:hypothetical protein